MAAISFIPSMYADGFKKMSAMDDQTFEDILEGLSYTSLVATLEILAEKVTKVKKLNFKELKEIFYSAGSLTGFLEKKISTNQIVDDVSTLAVNEKIIEEKDKDKFKHRLLVLLENQQIYYAAKSNRIMVEYGNVFIQARIITDIRPVFSIIPQETPKAGMIIHNLHIHYQAEAEGDHKDFFIALDAEDIKLLKETLERAETKETSLKPLFDKTGMTNLKD